MGAGLHGHAHFESCVSRVHVFFEVRITLRVAGKALRVRHAFGFSADFETFDQDSIQPDVDLMRLAHAHDVEVELALQKNLDLVLAIQAEVITDCRSAMRSEWKIVGDLIVLNQRRWNLDDVANRIDRGISYRKPADGACRREVAFQQHG